ncbi:MAG: hypothetical protein ACOCXM_00195 [Myxococcota bacterium]
MFRFPFLRLVLFPLLVVGLAACEEEEEPEETGPLVGDMEIPVSLRSSDSLGGDPLRIEVGAAELHLDGRKVLDLDAGELPEAERRDHRISKLESAIRGGGARDAAAVRLHVNTPYETMLAVLESLREVGVSQVGFEVRKGNGTETGFVVPADVSVREASSDPVEFDGTAQRQWDQVVEHWDTMHGACMKAKSIDCDGKPGTVAEGGDAEMTLRAWGKAVKLQLQRFGEPDEEGDGGVEESDEPAPVAMIPGVPVQATGGGEEEEEEEVEPETEAVFTWKLAAALQPESPISLATRPLCGAEPCGAVVTSEYRTPSMRTLAFIGAAFPDGAPAPRLVFVRAPR